MGTDTFAYDPQTDHWTAKAQYSPWSYGLMSATVDGIIYLFGGMTQDLTGSYDFALAYDPRPGPVQRPAEDARNAAAFRLRGH